MDRRCNLAYYCAIIVVLAVLSTPGECCGRGSIYIQNNGYRQVLVAVGEDVPENPTLIDRIKEYFTAASKRLYQATRNRAYLQEISILLPKTWSSKPEYKMPGNEAMDTSDIVVDKPDPRQGDTPFVLRSTPCGELGQYMHLTPNYLLDRKVAERFGPVDKLLVHEWAHLRYGVFDEYATELDPHFYSGHNGKVEATRCSYALEGDRYDKNTKGSCNSKGNLPDNNCRFRDYYGDMEPEYASLMYKQYLEHIVEFCDNDPKYPKLLHNPDAPTQQNRKCRRRSVWEVLRSHGDFKNLNPPRNISDTTPKFTLLRAQEKRYVLVLDISGSMRRQKLAALGRGCSNFIRNIIRDGEKLGIVHFATRAKIVADLTTIKNETREELLLGIPIRANGGTSIGAGIIAGMEVLEFNGGKPGGTARGGNLIIVSDGRENKHPHISFVWNEVLRRKVIVHTIAFTNKADSNMDRLAKATGGLSFLYSNNANSNALNEGFRAIAEQNQNIKDKKLPISSVAQEIYSGVPVSKQVSIDSTLGRDTEFIFDYSGTDIDISLMSPSGDEYLKTSPIVERDIRFGLYKFKFVGRGQSGKWNYTIKNVDILPQRVAVTVVSKSSIPGTYPIVAQAHWGHRKIDIGMGLKKQAVYATVSQGYKPVLNADVVAVIDVPTGGKEQIRLRDDGAGADQNKNDGIYSEYFALRRGDGRYNVQVLVNSNPATVISSIRVIGRGAHSPLSNAEYGSEPDQKVSDLERVASGGSFQLENSVLLPLGKVYPPEQVTDLKVESVDLNRRTVRLQWTAPGAELTKGRASKYEIRYSTDFDSISGNFSDQTAVQQRMLERGNLTGPSDPGTTEDFIIEMPSSGDITYVFSLVSWDLVDRDVQSEPSNTASAGMKAFKGVPSNNKTGVIVGSIFGTLVAIAIIIVVVIVVFRFTQQRNEQNNKGAAESATGTSNDKPIDTAPTPAPRGTDNKAFTNVV